MMDPTEQRLRNEVIYLHSLWHQGPPPPPPQPPPHLHHHHHHHHFSPPLPTHAVPVPLQQPQFHHRFPIQVPIFMNPLTPNPPFTQTLLRVSNPTPFKRNSKNRRKKKKDRNFNTNRDVLPSDSGKEWPCNENPSLDSHKWPESGPKKGSSSQPISEEEQAKLDCLRMQHRVMDNLHGIFIKKDDGDEEDDDEEEEEDDNGDDSLVESEEYKVFLDVFVKGNDLREYYEKNYENGEFYCFVCGVFGIKKSGKKYKSCLGLLQHSVSITKTTKRRAHRAFGMVICKVIGWDIGRLPTIIVKGEPLGRSLENSNVVRCDDEQIADIGKEDSKVVENESADVVNDGTIESIDRRIVEDDDHCADAVALRSSVNEGDACTHAGDTDGRERDMGIDNNGASNGIELDNDFGLQTLPKVDGTSGNFDNLNKQRADENVNVETRERMGAKISPVHGTEWPRQNITDGCYLEGWPTSKSAENSSAHVMSAEEKANFEAYKLQKRVLEACQDFFQSKSGSVNSDNEDVKMEDSDDDDGEGSEDDIVEGNESEECEAFKFFMRIFMENAELKNYYESNDEDGNFCCLVCGGVGTKTWKRFKGCTALLQHSLTISKTRKQAHRAFGRAMCKVFGWDINQFSKYATNVELLRGSLVK